MFWFVYLCAGFSVFLFCDVFSGRCFYQPAPASEEIYGGSGGEAARAGAGKTHTLSHRPRLKYHPLDHIKYRRVKMVISGENNSFEPLRCLDSVVCRCLVVTTEFCQFIASPRHHRHQSDRYVATTYLPGVWVQRLLCTERWLGRRIWVGGDILYCPNNMSLELLIFSILWFCLYGFL